MHPPRILLLDPHLPSRLGDALATVLSGKPPPRFEVVCQRSGDDTVDRQVERHRPEAVIDVLEDDRGCPGHRPGEWKVPALAALDAATPEHLIALLRSGYDDFILPPVSREQVVPRLWRAVDRERQPRDTMERIKEHVGLRRLIGQSPVFLDQVEKIPVVARCDAGVLISGETGTGKEIFARTIHYLSPRAQGPFIPVNCGAIPGELLENELFGHERGAFTGADRTRPGLVEEADGGTLFLDEIDALPPVAQVKLLRFLEDKEVRRLGSVRARRCDVRVIAASNVDLERAIVAGRLRRDLYYRLNVLPLHLPRLADRPEDIPLLARHFLARAVREFDRPLEDFTDGAMLRLLSHAWPGNVRELEHIVQRAVVLSREPSLVRRKDIELEPIAGEASATSFREEKAQAVARFERRYLKRMLSVHQGNITRAAAAAGKNRRAFWELIRKHGIDAGRFRAGAERPV